MRLAGVRGPQQQAADSRKIENLKSARNGSVVLEGAHPRRPEVTASRYSAVSARNDDFRVVTARVGRARGDTAKSSLPWPRAPGQAVELAPARVRRRRRRSRRNPASAGRAAGPTARGPCVCKEARCVAGARAPDVLFDAQLGDAVVQPISGDGEASPAMSGGVPTRRQPPARGHECRWREGARAKRWNSERLEVGRWLQKGWAHHTRGEEGRGVCADICKLPRRPPDRVPDLSMLIVPNAGERPRRWSVRLGEAM